MRRLFRFLTPYRRPVLFVIILVFMQSFAELYLPTLMASIVDQGVVPGNVGHIWRVGGLMLLVAAAGAGAAIAATYFSSRTASAFGRDVRTSLFRRVTSFSMHEFVELGTATLITRTTNDVTQVQQVLFMMLRMMISAPMMAVGGIIMAVAKDRALSLVIVVVIPVLAIVIGIIAAKGMPLFRALQEKIDTLNRVVRERLTGVRVVRAFNRTDHERRRFGAANRDLTDIGIRVHRLMAATMPVMMVILNMTTVAIMWFGGLRIDGGHMQVGDLMAFIQYVLLIMFSVLMVSMMFVIYPRAAVSAGRINEVLETVPEIVDAPDARRLSRPAVAGGGLAAGDTGVSDGAAPRGSQTELNEWGVVEFRNVTFHYPGAEQPAVSDISFRAAPGQTTAIIGGTGSGKSTIIQLLTRFYDVTDGQVLVDGVDVRERTQADLRAAIGLVPQKAVLFSGTIADNIRYGKQDATDEEIRRAAEVAQATEFIDALADGFDTVIDQGGANLSGGQRQRLTIARALVRRPRVYVFDDSFSALDFKTDAKVRTALRSETSDSSMIIVAQRVSSIMDADQIIVLDEGRAVGIGTHEELLRTCDVYREIVISQLGEEAAA